MTYRWGYPILHHPWAFSEKLQPQQNTAVKTIWWFAAWAVWCPVTDGHFWHPIFQQLQEFLIYFWVYLKIWFLTAKESILSLRAAGGLQAIFPAKTSAVPCPSQARTVAWLSGKGYDFISFPRSSSEGIWKELIDWRCVYFGKYCFFLSLRGNTFGDVLLLNYIRALWRVLYTMYCICKRNKQVHAGTKPGSAIRAQLFTDKGSTSDICAGLCSCFSHNIKQTEKN